VVYDFRSQDVILGGQGAPLVPVGDRLLFAEFRYRVNLGGFSNISYEEHGKTVAYDITAVNTVLNHYASRLGKAYDEGGNLARSGKLIMPLFEQLDTLSFYRSGKPSLGYEQVRDEILPLINMFEAEVPDILHTYTEHIAAKIGSELKGGEALFTGGGVYNRYLIERINHYSKARIKIPGELLVDYKEALIFALLGMLRIREEVNVYASVTGASRDHSSGTVIRM